MIYTVARTIYSVRVRSTGTKIPTPVSKRHRPLQITSRRNRRTDRCNKHSCNHCSHHYSNQPSRLRGRRRRCGCVRHRLQWIPKVVARPQLRQFRPTGWLRRQSNVGSCSSNCPRTSPGWWSCTCDAKKSTER